jgi:hypothetical protein
MPEKWKIEFYEDAQGRRPVEKWIDGLSDHKAEAVLLALQEVLAVNGITLTSGAWLKSLERGYTSFKLGTALRRFKRCTRLPIRDWWVELRQYSSGSLWHSREKS